GGRGKGVGSGGRVNRSTPNLVRERGWLPGECEPACVKGAGQQGAVAHEDQPASAAGRVTGDGGHILDNRDLVEESPIDSPVERAKVNAIRLLLPTRNTIEEMTPIRQKSWVRMRIHQPH